MIHGKARGLRPNLRQCLWDDFKEVPENHEKFIRLIHAKKIVFLLKTKSRTSGYRRKDEMKKRNSRFMPCMNMMRRIRIKYGTYRDYDEQKNPGEVFKDQRSWVEWSWRFVRFSALREWQEIWEFLKRKRFCEEDGSLFIRGLDLEANGSD